MKESRIIIIISILMVLVLIPLFYILELCGINSELLINIITNLGCGIIVALITSICQYCVSRRKVINNIYGLYFDLYRSYYYSKNKVILWHIDSYSLYKRMVELNPKIVSELDEYYGLLKKYDKTYKKLNPSIKLDGDYKAKVMIKSFIFWFNKKSFNNFFEPLIKETENILKNINRKRFEKDKAEMIRVFNYIWGEKNEQ